jgi:hypothetical protein
MTPFTFITDLIERWRFGEMCRPSPELPEPPAITPPEAPVSRPRTITRVGAWAGSSLLRDPLRNVLAAGAMGIDELHLMVADHSAWRREHAFSDRPTREEGGGRRAASIPDIIRVGRICAEGKINLGLTTWVMPHERYVDGLGLYLVEAVRRLYAEGCPAVEIILDAEEPWTKAVGTEPFGKSAAIRQWNRAGERLGAILAPLRASPYEARIGITGIGYANEPALDPLAEWCDFMIPQVYATTGNTLDPRTSPRRFAALWTKKFGAKEMVLGLPAYRQGKGMMAASLAGAREVAADPNSAMCSRVIYWSLPQIRASAAITRFVAGIKGGPTT